jgi:ribose 5-phosphate isomerase B
MRIVIGSDHAGFKLKAFVKEALAKLNHEVEDLGTDSDAHPTDYPDIAEKVARRLLELRKTENAFAVLCCGSGIGISIAANKVHGIRAAVVCEPTAARYCRLHNDANILCFGERFTGLNVVEESLKVFLSTDFEGGRHQRRVDKIDSIKP